MSKDAQADYRDATISKIVRPQKAKVGKTFDVWITQQSPVWQRRCVVQIRRYLHLECDYGMSFDDSFDCWKSLEVFPLLDKFYDDLRHESRQWMIGAVCFSDDKNLPLLKFCWLHPFWRNQGLLKRAWPRFVERFGEFQIEPPISGAMSGFLESLHKKGTTAEQAVGGQPPSTSFLESESCAAVPPL